MINENLMTANIELLREWDQVKNKGINPLMEQLHSAKKVWWFCGCGHEWEDTIKNRIDGDKCPACMNTLLKHSPLVEEWNMVRNRYVYMSDIRLSSKKVVWWKCKECHYEWKDKVFNRANGGKCPACMNKVKRTQVTTLSVGDSALAKEWHPYLNGRLIPEQIPIDSDKRVWWCCPICQNSWRATIEKRQSGGGCPKCKYPHSSEYSTQLIERYIRS